MHNLMKRTFQNILLPIILCITQSLLRSIAVSIKGSFHSPVSNTKKKLYLDHNILQVLDSIDA